MFVWLDVQLVNVDPYVIRSHLSWALQMLKETQPKELKCMCKIIGGPLPCMLDMPRGAVIISPILQVRKLRPTEVAQARESSSLLDNLRDSSSSHVPSHYNLYLTSEIQEVLKQSYSNCCQKISNISFTEAFVGEKELGAEP